MVEGRHHSIDFTKIEQHVPDPEWEAYAESLVKEHESTGHKQTPDLSQRDCYLCMLEANSELPR